MQAPRIVNGSNAYSMIHGISPMIYGMKNGLWMDLKWGHIQEGPPPFSESFRTWETAVPAPKFLLLTSPFFIVPSQQFCYFNSVNSQFCRYKLYSFNLLVKSGEINSLWGKSQFGGVLSHGGTPSHHPFLDGISTIVNHPYIFRVAP